MATILKRVGKSGEVSYRAQVRRKGHAIQTRTFRRLSDARKWARQKEADIDAGRAVPNAEAQRTTLAQMIDKYVEEILSRPEKARTNADQTHQLDWWKNQLGAFKLTEITPSKITRALRKLETETVDRLKSEKNPKGQRGPATVNRYLAALARVYTVAVEHWELVDHSPIRQGMKRQEPKGRKPELTPTQIKKLLDQCKQSKNPYLYAITLAALSCAGRKNEIRFLTWKHVNLDKKTLHFERTKNGDARTVPLGSQLHDELTRIKAEQRIERLDGKSFCFPAPTGNKPIDIENAWRHARKEAGLPWLRFHDLRHVAAGALKSTGASNAQIAAILGHRTLLMVQRYGAPDDPALSDAVTRANTNLFGDEPEGAEETEADASNE